MKRVRACVQNTPQGLHFRSRIACVHGRLDFSRCVPVAPRTVLTEQLLHETLFWISISILFIYQVELLLLLCIDRLHFLPSQRIAYTSST